MAAASLRQSDLRTAITHARMLTEASLFGQSAFLTADAAWTVAQVIEADRGTDAAHPAVTAIADPAQAGWDLLAVQPAAAAWLVRYLLPRGDRRAARRVAEAACLLAARNEEYPALRAAALHATGLLHAEPGRLLQAAAGHAHPWAAASAREDAGALLAARPASRASAVTALEQAMDGYHALGATYDLNRARSRLHQLGRRYHYARWSVRPSHPCDNLTDTEARVVGLVAQGLTNIQIGRQMYLSQHTIAFHLKRIFKKLGVSSRGELTSHWHHLTSRTPQDPDRENGGIRSGVEVDYLR
jgi:DNA-binding CsgD family transcriptional regulator